MENKKPLNIFFGSLPSSEFINDLAHIEQLPVNETLKVIELIFDWYSKDSVIEEWGKWKEQYEEEEHDKRARVMNAFLYIIKEFATEKVTESELISDFKSLNIPSEVIESIRLHLKSNDEFIVKSLSGKKLLNNYIYDLEWRIDDRVYKDKSQEKIVNLDLKINVNGKSKLIPIEFSAFSFNHFLSILTNIQNKL